MSSSSLSPADYLYRSLSQLRLVQCLLHLASQSDDGLSGEELADLAEVVQAALDGLDNVADFVPEEADSAKEVRHAQ